MALHDSEGVYLAMPSPSGRVHSRPATLFYCGVSMVLALMVLVATKPAHSALHVSSGLYLSLPSSHI